VIVARGGREAGVLRVLVLADDLTWATRLVGRHDDHATLPAWLGVPVPAFGSLPAPQSFEVPAR
jgi:hypothetical protein